MEKVDDGRLERRGETMAGTERTRMYLVRDGIMMTEDEMAQAADSTVSFTTSEPAS